MTDSEFADEVAARLNRFLELNYQRAHATLITPLTHVGYANVAHMLGQLCLPHGMTQATAPEAMLDTKFLMPVIDKEKGQITGFESVTGAELQKRAQEAQEEE